MQSALLRNWTPASSSLTSTSTITNNSLLPDPLTEAVQLDFPDLGISVVVDPDEPTYPGWGLFFGGISTDGGNGSDAVLSGGSYTGSGGGSGGGGGASDGSRSGAATAAATQQQGEDELVALELVDSVISDLFLSTYTPMVEVANVAHVGIRNSSILQLEGAPAAAWSDVQNGEVWGLDPNPKPTYGPFWAYGVGTARMEGVTCAGVVHAFGWGCFLLDFDRDQYTRALALGLVSSSNSSSSSSSSSSSDSGVRRLLPPVPLLLMQRCRVLGTSVIGGGPARSRTDSCDEDIATATYSANAYSTARAIDLNGWRVAVEYDARYGLGYGAVVVRPDSAYRIELSQPYAAQPAVQLSSCVFAFNTGNRGAALAVNAMQGGVSRRRGVSCV